MSFVFKTSRQAQSQYDQVRVGKSLIRLGLTLEEWQTIKRIGSRLQHLYENSCNGFQTPEGKWDNDAEKMNDLMAERHERKAREFATAHKLHIYLQTDPRGATIYLDTVEIPDNNYTTSVCIY